MKKLFENWKKYLSESKKAEILDDLADAEREEQKEKEEEKEKQEKKDKEQDKMLKNASRESTESEISANAN